MAIGDNDVLPSHTQLDIWEVYARLVLEFIDEASYGHLLHGDKPDLYDITRNLGVEVTRAIPESNQEADALYARLRSVSDEISRAKIIERIEQIGGKVFDRWLLGPKGTDNFNLVINAFGSKLDKLNSGGYEIYAHNHLFVRSCIYADGKILEGALADFVSFNVKPKRFERVIVSVPGFNYDFNLDNRTFSVLAFSSADQFAIAETARSIVVEAEG